MKNYGGVEPDPAKPAKLKAGTNQRVGLEVKFSGRPTVDEKSLTHPSAEGHDHQDHPHACLSGYVYLGYTAVDEETGEEVERIEALPCRRCAEDK
jgi:hypothetical protein